MRLVSTNNPSIEASWREAVLSGLAPDGGLYLPAQLPSFSAAELQRFRSLSFPELCTELAAAFLGAEVPHSTLAQICQESFSFPLPLRAISDDLSVLELFHGPTCAFKDFGARFMSRLFRHFWGIQAKPLTVIVATSGDTGGAVANAFFDPSPSAPIRVAVLFPKGKVTPVQEKQMTALGGNVTAFEVDGTFDDCQKLAKQALADEDLLSRAALTSANSINIARLLPQMFYYVYASLMLADSEAPIVSVPSGNLGNVTGGLMAKAIGAPLHHFVAALNANRTFEAFLQSGRFLPQPSIETISNAMDVGNPSNLARISALYAASMSEINSHLSAFSITEAETIETMRSIYQDSGYILDPHTAVGVAALRRFKANERSSRNAIVAATAHPAKFAHVVKRAIDREPPLLPQLSAILNAPGRKVPLSNSFRSLKEAMIR